MAPASGRLAKVCYESRHFLRVFSSSEISVIASVTEGREDGITETHKQLSHVHRNPGQRTSSFSLFPFLSLCVSHSHLLACINKATRHTHTHSRTNIHTHTHLLPRYVHDLTPVSKTYEHQACCHTKFSTLSTHRQISLPLHF